MSLPNLLRSAALPIILAELLSPAGLAAQTSTVVGVGCHGMALVTDELPDVTTAPFNFQVSGIPAATVLNTIWYSFSSTGSPIDLGFLGAPGCPLFLATPILYAFNFTPVGTTETFTSGAPNPLIYNAALWLNVSTTWQAVSFVPGINPSWIATSNAVDLVGG